MDSFTTETYLSRQILLRLNEIFYNLSTKTTILPVNFKVEEKDKHLRFITSGLGFIFLGVMAKCITDIMIDHLNQNLDPNVKNKIDNSAKKTMDQVMKNEQKICDMCGYPNRTESHFCALCGTKF
jgi:hypothetical protein